MNSNRLETRAAPRPGLFFLGFVLLAAITLVALALITPVQAGDEGVYGPVAPPDSAFIRVFNATNQQIDEAHVADKVFSEIAPYGASEFAFLPAGSYTLTAPGLNQNLSLAKNRFYTAVVSGGQVKLIDTDRFSNRLKSLVLLYNLTDGAQMSLKTPDGKTAVVDGVGPNAAGAREVNAVRVNLALYEGDRKVADVKPVNLQRGKAFSLFAAGSKDSPVTVWVVN